MKPAGNSKDSEVTISSNPPPPGQGEGFSAKEKITDFSKCLSYSSLLKFSETPFIQSESNNCSMSYGLCELGESSTAAICLPLTFDESSCLKDEYELETREGFGTTCNPPPPPPEVAVPVEEEE